MSKKTENQENQQSTENAETKSAPKAPRMVRCLKGNLIADLQIGGKYTVTGQTTNYEIGQTNFGAFTTFFGQFAMKHTGQIYTSGKLIVPEVAAAMIRGQLDSRPEDDKGNKEGVFVFAVNIEKVASEKSVTKYEWAASFPENIKVEIPRDPFVALLENV